MNLGESRRVALPFGHYSGFSSRFSAAEPPSTRVAHKITHIQCKPDPGPWYRKQYGGPVAANIPTRTIHISLVSGCCEICVLRGSEMSCYTISLSRPSITAFMALVAIDRLYLVCLALHFPIHS